VTKDVIHSGARTGRTRGGWIWFAFMAGGWMAFFALLLFSAPTLGSVRDTIRDLPLLIEGLVWLVFFPFVLAVTVWDSAWDTWLRVLAVSSFAAGWSVMFYPWPRRRRSAAPSRLGSERG
jgi:hypothetical protein